VGLVGLIVIGAGIQTFYRVGTAYFMDLYPKDALSKRKQRLARRIGRGGLSALGLTLCIIGGFFVKAAFTVDASQALGIGGALDALGAGPYGFWFMGALAVGFICYGVHCFVLARYRRIRAVTNV
jgi:hypothetical protein